LPDGPLDILVNNAGIWAPTPVDGDDWSENFDRIIDTNLRAVAELCRQFSARAAPGACIVNVSSRASHRGEAGYSAYAASKAAVNALTKSFATELGPRGIRVNAVAPGWVLTDMTAAHLEHNPLPEAIPLGRVGNPDDVAGPVLFLCSDLSRYVTGVVLDVCGGAYLH
ncbi:MAG: SDR family oxidoreductase, partial [Planctomycetota bacterium]|nr:SDR family oxidoreductase [Planctomycetota bacterium]